VGGDHPGTENQRTELIRVLRELIAALDGRVPHLERSGETRIADDAKALRTKAVQRIAELGSKPNKPGGP
jgi:hypothetical protein